MARVIAPNPNANGIHAGAEFVDGVAETDNEASIAYFITAGYEVDGVTYTPEAVPVIDSRDLAEPVQVGTPLRDAAVDPRPEDFLPPVNAGQADPHGPLVVNPELHAEGVGPIVPGPVSDDAEEQAAIESSVAEAIRVNGELVPDATSAAAEANDETAAAVERPAKSASAADWRAFAESQGVDPSGSKAEIIARFDTVTEES